MLMRVSLLWICLILQYVTVSVSSSVLLSDDEVSQRFSKFLRIDQDVSYRDFDHKQIDYGPNGHPLERMGSRKQQQQQQQQQQHQRRFQEGADNEATTNEFQPLRVSFNPAPIEERRNESTETDARIDEILNSILPLASERWSSHLSIIPSSLGIPVDSNECGGLFPNLEAQSFEETDLVIIVSAYNSICDAFPTVAAYASLCALDQTGRPVVGFMNFCLDQREDTNYNLIQSVMRQNYGPFMNKTLRRTHAEQSLYDVAFHEMAHVLGIFANLYIYFRNPDGSFRTPQDANGSFPQIEKRCANGTIVTGEYPSDDSVTTIQMDDGTWRQYLVSPRVQQVARNFFNCSTLIGARLEDDQEACIGSHWHERDYFTELMSPATNERGRNELSPLTLALLEEYGFYQVNYEGSVLPSYGIGAGCNFVNEDCIINETVPEWAQNEFCTSPLELSVTQQLVSRESLQNVFCDPSHTTWAVCDLTKFENETGALPGTIFYFEDKGMRPVSDKALLADSCPITEISLGLDCSIDDPYNVFYPGESVGADSRCLNAYYNSPVDGIVNQPACMAVICDETNYQVRVAPGVLDLTCEYDNQVLLIPGTENSFIRCPRLAVICPDMFLCKNACSAKGECLYENGTVPFCSCMDDFDGPACASRKSTNGTPAPSTPTGSLPTTSQQSSSTTPAPSIPGSDETNPTLRSATISPTNDKATPVDAQTTTSSSSSKRASVCAFLVLPLLMVL